MDDEIERLRKDLADDALGDVLPCHQRCIHESMQCFGGIVGVNGAEKSATGVDSSAQLECLRAAHLAYDNAVWSHREYELLFMAY
jgi:hypothetical protein